MLLRIKRLIEDKQFLSSQVLNPHLLKNHSAKNDNDQAHTLQFKIDIFMS